MPGRSVFAGFYSNWRDLSEETQNKVKSSRKKKNLTKISGNKSSKIKTLVKEVTSLKRHIAKTNVSIQET